MSNQNANTEGEILGQRPRDFYGPDDWDEGMDPLVQDEETRAAQRGWDKKYNSLSWWKRLLHSMDYTVRLPVNQS